MELVLLFLLLVGIFLLFISIKFYKRTCPPPKVIYRFVPRTFKEEQDDPVLASDIFGAMFTDKSI